MPEPRTRVVLATRNAGKLREIAALLCGLPIELVPLPESVALPEEGDAYEANALAKAEAAAHATGHPALGDDSGLEVDALGGAPGPQSARWGGPGLDDAGRNALLLAKLDGVDDAQRGARFVCVAACATPDGRRATARGVCEGRIARAPRGGAGFGYDPVFEVGARTFAELAAPEKDAASHRGRAFRALAPSLRALLAAGG
ncbi:MAG: non-canonical purine NTP pyrophosphatase, RdgB/HAM1 family [Proteobacteria bacterium]|nr:MAG: non-canonical purine NTP pyrophosphatase, RdgB/HAM1 family [Pseudomonadota bacterium]